MRKMKYFLFTNAPNVYANCTALWQTRAMARETLLHMSFLEYHRLFRGNWEGGIIPRGYELKEVKISTLLREVKKNRG